MGRKLALAESVVAPSRYLRIKSWPSMISIRFNFEFRYRCQFILKNVKIGLAIWRSGELFLLGTLVLPEYELFRITARVEVFW